jgi:iron complex transport system substrate-binding protein
VRIVSLLPSATEIICELGLTNQLVARSEECNWPLEVASLPVVSLARVNSATLDSAAIDQQVRSALATGAQLYSIDEVLLRSLRPDVIVTQDLCHVCAVSSDNICDVGAQIISLDPRTITEVADSVRMLATALGVPLRGDQVAERMLTRISSVREQVSTAHRPRVFFAEWLTPPFASGHWIPEMVEAAGGIEVLGRVGEPSRSITWQMVRDAQPDIVILGPCGFDKRRAEHEASTVRHEFDPRWHVAYVNADRFFARPAPSIADGVEQLFRILHQSSRPRGLPTNHPQTELIMQLHDDAIRKGEPGYLDPQTGFYVMTVKTHLDRGNCCNSACRHCPYVA